MTVAWDGFVHSWYVLGGVLKWMCITVVGIPGAIAICIFIGLCALVFLALCLLAFLSACLLVYLALKLVWCFFTRWPYWISQYRMARAERELLRGFSLSGLEAGKYSENRGSGSTDVHQPRLEPLRPDFLGPSTLPRAPPRVHLALHHTISQELLGPGISLPGAIECQVCLEEKLPWMFPARAPTDRCDHESSNCCSTCLAQSIKTAFNSNMWDDIRCPMCNLQLQYKDVREFATSDIFSRYDTLSARRALEQSVPNFRWCIGPNCSDGHELPEDHAENPIVVCTSCGFTQCSKHNVPWHDGRTCAEYDEMLAENASGIDKRSEKIIALIAKRCPGCQKYISRNGGCGHMTCACKTEFCWSCLHEYPGHKWGCPRRL